MTKNTIGRSISLKIKLLMLSIATLVLYAAVSTPVSIIATDADETIPPDSRVYYATYYATDFASQEEFEASLEASQHTFYKSNDEFLAANSDAAEIGYYSSMEEYLICTTTKMMK